MNKSYKKIPGKIGRQGINLFGEWDIRAFPERGKKPYNISPQLAQRLSNGNTLICECWDIIEITPELDIVWQFGEWPVNGNDDTHLNQALSAWYYDETGKIIIADTRNNRVLEVDKNTKRITRKITNLNHPASAFLNPDNGNVIVCEGAVVESNPDTGEVITPEGVGHYVYEMDWNGRIVWDFGVRGKSGNDSKHLKDPWFAYPAKTGWDKSFDGILISDYGNNRVILVRKEDKKIVRETLSCGPEMAFQMHNLGIAVTGQVVGFTTDQDWHIRWYTPDNWRLIPTPEASIILIDRVNLYEVDPKLFPIRNTIPGSYRILTNYKLAANKSAGPIESDADFKETTPISVFGFRDGFTIYVKTTQQAKLDILTAKTKWSYAPTVQFDGWEICAEGIVVTPGKLYSYRTRDNHVFIGIKVTMGSIDGLVDAWIAWGG